MIDKPDDVPTFTTFTELIDWCWKVRIGEIKTSREVRDFAKVITFAKAYGFQGRRV